MADETVLNKAAIIERCLRRVHQDYDGHESTLETDFTQQDAIVLNLQRACEAAIDLAMHMTRARKLGLPRDAREAFTLLEQAGLIGATSAKRMRAMVGFRNIAVHHYQNPSLPTLHAILDQRLTDFTDFTQAMIRASA